MKNILMSFALSFLLSGCAVGHKPWVEIQNDQIGQKVGVLDPNRFGNAGELIRANFLVAGKGFTHITEDKNGNVIQHWFVSEVLPNYYDEDGPFGLTTGVKEWVGKCKYYYVVDPETHVIKGWGIDEGGNPQSCRVWQ